MCENIKDHLKIYHKSNSWLIFHLQIGNEGLAADLTDDPDTEEALKEFDFLVTAEDGEGAGEARSSGDGTEWGKVIKKYGGGRTSSS